MGIFFNLYYNHYSDENSLIVVLFKSLKNCKIRNKGNVTLKSNNEVRGWGSTLSYFK